MAKKYRISTDTGAMENRDDFLKEISGLKNRGHRWVNVCIERPETNTDRMRRFFFVIIEQIAVQNKYPDIPTRDDIAATGTYLKQEFVPIKKREIVLRGGSRKIVESIPSLTNLNVKNFKIFIDNILNWCVGNGYETPDPEEFEKMAKEIGVPKAREYFRDRLLKTLKARYESKI